MRRALFDVALLCSAIICPIVFNRNSNCRLQSILKFQSLVLPYLKNKHATLSFFQQYITTRVIPGQYRNSYACFSPFFQTSSYHLRFKNANFLQFLRFDILKTSTPPPFILCIFFPDFLLPIF